MLTFGRVPSVFLARWGPISMLVAAFKVSIWGFPGGAVVEIPLANARDTGSSPGPGGSYMPQSNQARA